MPDVGGPSTERSNYTFAANSLRASFFSHCANPRCSTGWMQMWRNRRAPAFEGRWACSAGCMEEIVRLAVHRETGGPSHPYAHRLPLGLTLIEQGRITQEDLRHAIVARDIAVQEGRGATPLDAWLVESGILNETMLTRALSAQWSCPVFSMESEYCPAEVATALPRLLAEAFGAVPLRAAGGNLLYVAFANRIDRSLAYAMERMLGVRLTSGVLRDSEYLRARGEFLEEAGPATKFLEAATVAALARLLTRCIEQEKPAEARLVGVHEYCWLRMWKQAPRGEGLPKTGDVEDIVCTVGQKFGDIP
jgi:Type II secretion system (T2SS), protein E, N-terminal domain